MAKSKWSEDLIDGFAQLKAALQRGDDLKRKFNLRTVSIDLAPTRYNQRLVVRTRKMLNVSQTMFATFLGVTPNTVRAWEQGVNEPSGIAARFLDEIRHDPQYWRNRLTEVVVAKPAARRKRSRRAKAS